MQPAAGASRAGWSPPIKFEPRASSTQRRIGSSLCIRGGTYCPGALVRTVCGRCGWHACCRCGGGFHVFPPDLEPPVPFPGGRFFLGRECYDPNCVTPLAGEGAAGDGVGPAARLVAPVRYGGRQPTRRGLLRVAGQVLSERRWLAGCVQVSERLSVSPSCSTQHCWPLGGTGRPMGELALSCRLRVRRSPPRCRYSGAPSPPTGLERVRLRRNKQSVSAAS